MKRNMDLIRKIMLEIENGKKYFEIRSDEVSRALGCEELGMTREEADNWDHHLNLIDEKGLVNFTKSCGGIWSVQKISWDGHEFINSVRDPEIWEKTKNQIEGVGAFSFEIVKSIAKGFIKTKLEKHTGMKIDL